MLTSSADDPECAACWRDFSAGTGAMIEALAGEELDLALLLTEGAVAGIAGGGDYRIVSWYTQSPLIWGIHVPADSTLSSVEELGSACYAISRTGSGSHLMAYVLAEQQGWPAGSLRFNAVGGLDGAVRALGQGEADVFLWEKFMTQPFVTNGSFRRVGELVAPWPAFVVCASVRMLSRDAAAVASTVADGLSAARRLAGAPDAAAEIARAFGLEEADAARWLGETRWAERVGVEAEPLQRALRLLGKVGVVDAAFGGPLIARLDGG